MKNGGTFMKIVIIGLEAAGAAAATRARRNSEEATITVYDQAPTVSHIPCAIPYYLGDEIADINQLIPRSPQWFKEEFNIDVCPNHQVTKIQSEQKTLEVLDWKTNVTKTVSFDKLIIATGASPFVPSPFNSSSYENIFSVRSLEDARKIHSYIEKKQVKRTCIIGSGSIGLEIAEQLANRGIDTTIVEIDSQLIPKMDKDMAAMIEEEMKEKGVRILTKDYVEKLEGKENVTSFVTHNGVREKTDLIIIATGVRPNSQLGKECGLEIGKSGGFVVDKKMETSTKDIYAAGDVAESFSILTHKPLYCPLAATATKMGRIAGDAATNGSLEHQGVLGTGIFRVFDLSVGITGLTEREAQREGVKTCVTYTIHPNKSVFFGGKDMVIKAIADEESGKVLGAQMIGGEGVDKRLDVLATAITFGAQTGDLQHLDLGYSVPFSTPWDPVHIVGMSLTHSIKENRYITPTEFNRLQKEDVPVQIIDVREYHSYEHSHIEKAIHSSVHTLRRNTSTMNKEDMVMVYCERGEVSTAAERLLFHSGFKNVRILSGGFQHYKMYNHHPVTV